MTQDHKRDVVDIMLESQHYRSLVFHIASIPLAERSGLSTPAGLEKSWPALIQGNNADYAVLNYYTRTGLLK